MIFSHLLNQLDHFWREHPALLYGLSFLLGCVVSSDWNWGLIFPITLLWGPLAFFFLLSRSLRERLSIALILAVIGLIYSTSTHSFPHLPAESGLPGTAIFDISFLTTSSTHYGLSHIYQGTLREFNSTQPEGNGRSIPCRITLKENKGTKLPPANCSYQIQGVLKESSGSYSFVPAKSSPWIPLKNTWSSAQLRHDVKKSVSNYLHRCVPNKQSAEFLAGIATGNFDNRLISFQFSRFGLQHIMAISGFHFTVFVLVLSMILRWILPKKPSSLLLLVLLSGYFVFLGCTPSILRAWIASMIALAGHLFDRQGNGLNSLGSALIAMLLFNPLMTHHIGFQFSFAVTAAILLFYRGCDFFMQTIFVKRSLYSALKMNGLNQHGYFILVLLRQGVALTIAVHSVALPLTLYYFHKFPLLSLLYNLFFPFMVTISMLLLIIGTLTSILPFVGQAIHSFNSLYTEFMLNFVYNMPTNIDIVWHTPSFPEWLLILYLSAVFAFGIWLRYFLKGKNDEAHDLEFL